MSEDSGSTPEGAFHLFHVKGTQTLNQWLMRLILEEES